VSGENRKVKKTLAITASVAAQVEVVSAQTGIDQSRIYEDGARLLLEQRKREQELLEQARAAEQAKPAPRARKR
jgi:hypothetical protein